MTDLAELFEAHLNASWLRPENVVWDTVASYWVRQQGFRRPTLDLGAGNGLFSFLTAGGRFDVDFDWFVQVEVDASLPSGDLYNARPCVLAPPVIRVPADRIDVALDHKPNLLEQASLLNLYDQTVVHDANEPLPFNDGEFMTVFSNILHWLEKPLTTLRECRRILGQGGQAILCLPDARFSQYCESYQWRALGSEWLRLLNGGRDACIRWTATRETLEQWAGEAGFHVVHHRPYLHERTLHVWDLGLRPLSRPLIKLVNGLESEARASLKREWMAAARPLLWALLEEELKAPEPAGFHLFVLEKR